MARAARGDMRIKCAAIRYEGEIYEGVNHASIGIKMVMDGVCPRPYPSGDNQGFVTECGTYVRRAPALGIAIEAGQVVRGETLSSRDLYSEDYRDVGPSV